MDISQRDWRWLQRELHIQSDWELHGVRTSFWGRLCRLREPPRVFMELGDRYIPGPGGPYRPPTSYPTFGARAWEYRARIQPLRQRPEWQLSDADVVARSKHLDPRALDTACPARLPDLAESLIPSLGALAGQAAAPRSSSTKAGASSGAAVC